ncbi:MAG: hypothetical protein ACLFQB_04595 [Chitinispirillaceae bacterium]
MICSIEDVTAGMKTEENVTAGGRVLLPRGTVLTSSQIAAIRKWGVSQIVVEGNEALSTQQMEKVMDEIAPRFFYTEGEFTRELHKAVSRWIIRRRRQQNENEKDSASKENHL